MQRHFTVEKWCCELTNGGLAVRLPEKLQSDIDSPTITCLLELLIDVDTAIGVRRTDGGNLRKAFTSPNHPYDSNLSQTSYRRTDSGTAPIQTYCLDFLCVCRDNGDSCGGRLLVTRAPVRHTLG